MKAVRTDRNLWRDLVLWFVVLYLAILIIGGVFVLMWMPHVAIILSILGSIGWLAYSIIYFTDLTNDLNTVCGKVNHDREESSWSYVLVWLVSLLTFGTYGLYWYYKQGGRLTKALGKYGVETQENGIAFLLWKLIFGMGGIVADYLLIKNLNKACIAYEKGGSSDNQGRNVEKGEGNVKTNETIATPVIMGVRGEYAGRRIPISVSQPIIMGRDPSQANLVFGSDKISKVHCVIIFSANDNCYYVTNQSSTNGTTVDGTHRLEVGARERVNRGSQISLGQSEQFHLR